MLVNLATFCQQFSQLSDASVTIFQENIGIDIAIFFSSAKSAIDIWVRDPPAVISLPARSFHPLATVVIRCVCSEEEEKLFLPMEELPNIYV